jgi:hypothetical protein
MIFTFVLVWIKEIQTDCIQALQERSHEFFLRADTLFQTEMTLLPFYQNGFICKINTLFQKIRNEFSCIVERNAIDELILNAEMVFHAHNPALY